MTDQSPTAAPADNGDQADRVDRSSSQVQLDAISSKDLLKDRGQVLIDHDGTIYRLMVTRNGGLILQK